MKFRNPWMIGALLALPPVTQAQTLRAVGAPAISQEQARPFLGIYPAETADGMGVRLTDVVEESGAAQAGLQAGDVIVAIAGEEVESMADLSRILAQQQAGDKVKITFVRDGERRKTRATLGKAPAAGQAAEEAIEEIAEDIRSDWRESNEGEESHAAPSSRGWLGVTISDSDDGGVEIIDVQTGSPAERGGLLPGDVVTMLGAREVETVDDLVEGVAASEPGRPVTITLRRDGERRRVRFELGHAPAAEEADEPEEIVEWHEASEHEHEHEHEHEPDAPALPATGGWLGVSISDADRGAEVVEVVAGSPAAEAGLRVGDVITSIDEDEIGGTSDLIASVSSNSPGTRVTVQFERNGKQNKAKVRLGQRGAAIPVAPTPPTPPVLRAPLRQLTLPGNDARVEELREELDRARAEIHELRRMIQQQRAALERVRRALDGREHENDDPNVVVQSLSFDAPARLTTRALQLDDGGRIRFQLAADPAAPADCCAQGETAPECCDEADACCKEDGKSVNRTTETIQLGDGKAYKLEIQNGKKTYQVQEDGQWRTVDGFPAEVQTRIRTIPGKDGDEHAEIECIIVTSDGEDTTHHVTNDGTRVEVKSIRKAGKSKQ